MFQYSISATDGWIGNYESPFQALENGRSQYGDDTTIFVREPKQAHYRDFIPDVRILLSDMKEKAAEITGSEGADSFDLLEENEIAELAEAMRTLFFDWEETLRPSSLFEGSSTAKSQRYLEGQYPLGSDGW
jgi:hypothetical protein